jgi:phytoene dehydrogenase-like protein
MPDKSYDAIIVGGGHHGTIMACYLQQAGLKTVIFERQQELGGGCGRNCLCPGSFRIPAPILPDSGPILLIPISI